MGRIQNVKNITTFGLIKYVLQLILKFILQSVIIRFLGSEYVGVNGLFNSIFSLLNLAELGIGSAIVFSMYKPISENNIEKVKTLNNLYKKLYLYIALIIGSVGVLVTPFLSYIISEEERSGLNINIYIVYLLFLFNMVISYLSAHKRSLLFAYQRNDVEIKIKSITLILTTLTQILLIYFTRNYYVYVAVMIVGTILDCIIVQTSANKLYPEINGPAQKLDVVTRKQIVKNVRAMFLHKIGSAVVTSTDSILILTYGALASFSSYEPLKLLGYYSNYLLIIESIVMILSLIVNGLKASVGSYIAEKSKEEVYHYYNMLNFVFSWIVGFCAICLMCLFQPFMTIWNSFADNITLLPNYVVLLMVLSFYFTKMRLNTNMFKDCAGLMWNDRWKPIVESVVNLIASILLALWIGLPGVIIGTIISTLIAPLWVEPLVLYKDFFKKPVKYYFLRYAMFFLITIFAGGICYYICSLIPMGIGWFILKCFICAILPNLIFLLFLFKTKDFKDIFNLSKKIILKK